ncbi:hypothetical protein, partial [Pseudomonas syringae group genomosp. 7]|uniref:hypothetical protein n=1 Tax=Pseudomonas syringae group genomosp. 7 TaxID=251699 RepID=UPI00376FAB43
WFVVNCRGWGCCCVVADWVVVGVFSRCWLVDAVFVCGVGFLFGGVWLVGVVGFVGGVGGVGGGVGVGVFCCCWGVFSRFLFRACV